MVKTIVPATLLCDFYKISHKAQYPDGTEVVYSTWTPRSNKHYPSVDKVVAFGMQGMVKKVLIDYFNTHFFARTKEEVVAEYERYLKFALGVAEPDSTHIAELHDLGYLPLEIKTLPEGTKVPMRVPMMTVRNTDNRFFWLTNYIETLASCEMWLPTTAATIADRYRQILDRYAIETVGSTEFVPFQGHDFSMRGMGGIEAAALSGSGHLLSFVGTDTIPAIAYHEAYYNADIESELVGTSIPATEHSVMCAGGADNEFDTYDRLINKVYPSGMVSIVSDTWDLWNTITNILPKLKDGIMARDGKVVIRPDSGDPVDIICGVDWWDNKEHFESERHLLIHPSSEELGVIELLWDIFGGTTNDLGFKELDPHIGCIYGDSITPERAEEILKRLKAKGFASTNVVFGIGSYTYQYNTRDTFGFAMKSTAVVINGEERMIFKDPITDDGTKKSNTGGVVVVRGIDGELHVTDGLSIEETGAYINEMRTTFKDGELIVDDSLATIRKRLSEEN